MAKTKGMRPATRDDVGNLGRKLLRRMDRVEKRLDTKFDRLAVGLVNTNARIDLLRSEMSGAMRQLESRVTDKLESFASRMETIWRESWVIPRGLDEHRRILDDHESRIGRLEGPSRSG